MTYRICRKCGKKVNVSSQLRHDKKYICPRCAGEPWYMTREGLVREVRKTVCSSKSTKTVESHE